MRRRALVLTALLGLAVLPVTAAHSDTPEVWSVDLTGARTNVIIAGGSVRLADPQLPQLAAPRATGSVVTAPHRLPTPVRALSARIDADRPAGSTAQVDIREQVQGHWSEWVPAGSAFPAPATVVQARITLTAGAGAANPAVHAVDLVPSATAAAAPPKPAGLVRSRVFATREGLVGGTTANGHVIVSRDHFVALPSRRGLATKNTGDYTVRLCAENGRCEWAPVWDVGPWNTTDDYWSPASVRESWKDLPQGMPQAQAAFESQYNGGRDGFDRTVSNPAGIDLGDGVFWDGLKLTTNSWVDVAYLWTDDARSPASS
ncbi:MAG TPA: hypothetical protein VHC49_26295 [Mycobacteriales bacterium]|nr:hypothetical protein [Mycobacteriales bacterium]